MVVLQGCLVVVYMESIGVYWGFIGDLYDIYMGFIGDDILASYSGDDFISHY